MTFTLGENFPSWILSNELLGYWKAAIFGEALTKSMTLHRSFSLCRAQVSLLLHGVGLEDGRQLKPVRKRTVSLLSPGTGCV